MPFQELLIANFIHLEVENRRDKFDAVANQS
jgi:hypothetical protein